MRERILAGVVQYSASTPLIAAMSSSKSFHTRLQIRSLVTAHGLSTGLSSGLQGGRGMTRTLAGSSADPAPPGAVESGFVLDDDVHGLRCAPPDLLQKAAARFQAHPVGVQELGAIPADFQRAAEV